MKITIDTLVDGIEQLDELHYLIILGSYTVNIRKVLSTELDRYTFSLNDISEHGAPLTPTSSVPVSFELILEKNQYVLHVETVPKRIVPYALNTRHEFLTILTQTILFSMNGTNPNWQVGSSQRDPRFHGQQYQPNEQPPSPWGANPYNRHLGHSTIHIPEDKLYVGGDMEIRYFNNNRGLLIKIAEIGDTKIDGSVLVHQDSCGPLATTYTFDWELLTPTGKVNYTFNDQLHPEGNLLLPLVNALSIQTDKPQLMDLLYTILPYALPPRKNN